MLFRSVDEVRALRTPSASPPPAPDPGSLRDLDAALVDLGCTYTLCHDGAARRLSFGETPGRDAFVLELSKADGRYLFARATPVGDPPLPHGRRTIEALHALNAGIAMGTVFIGASRTDASYFIALPLAFTPVNLDVVRYLVGRSGATIERMRAELPRSR